MNNYTAPKTLRSSAIAALAALAAAALVAGCGSSSSSSTITVGAENSANNALAKVSEATGTATTPTSGPLSTEPTIPAQTGTMPTKMVTKELIVGTGAEAQQGETVTVNYVGALYKGGKVFDASWRRKEPFKFVVGQGQVIAGWEVGVKGMKVGGRRLLIVPPGLAYGNRGTGAIPPNATLVFVIDLLAV